MKIKINKIQTSKGDKPSIIMTTTDEIFQPIRLYYQLHNIKSLIKIFNELSCMYPDADNKRWVWFYKDEAHTLKFKKSYSSIPEEYQPLVLGSFYSKNNSEMYLDVASIERAVAALKFFSNYLNKKIAVPMYFAIYNKLLSAKEHPGTNFDVLFADVNTEEILTKQRLKIAAIMSALEFNYFENLEKHEFDLVEALPINIEDGIKLFEASLFVRQNAAIRKWEENQRIRKSS